MEDEFELFDWVQNNMRWDDLSPYAKLVKEDKCDLDEEWDDGNHTISANW